MLDSVPTILSQLPLINLILAIILASLNWHNFKRSLFACILLLTIGFNGLWLFTLHRFLPELKLDSLHTHNISLEANLAYLAMGIAGISATFASWSYRAAVVTFVSVLLWGQAIDQIYHLFWLTHFSFNFNISLICYNLIIPLLLISLLISTHPRKRDDIIFY